jgi:hypothetical protein
VHRGFTPERQRRRQLLGRVIQVAGLGGFAWYAYLQYTRGRGAPLSIEGWVGLGGFGLMLFLLEHWIPARGHKVVEGEPPIRLTPDRRPRADRWYRRR